MLTIVNGYFIGIVPNTAGLQLKINCTTKRTKKEWESKFHLT